MSAAIGMHLEAPPPAKTRSDWHRVGAGLSVRFSFEPADPCVAAEWSPRPPTRRELKRVIERYRAARDRFLVVVAQQVGGAVACVEVPR